MKPLNEQISLSDAITIAESAAYRNLESFFTEEGTKVLADDFVEGEHCWIFFRNKEIFVPPEGQLRGGWSYAVSKTGELREIADFSSDEQKLKEYLDIMSDYFFQHKNPKKSR